MVGNIRDAVGLAVAKAAPMKPQQETTAQEVLAGLVERVTFHNGENGFCVLRLKARGHRELITVIGHAAIISPGEWVTASGDWVNDHTHGQQFKARFMRTSAPTSIDGMEKYLGSGMIHRTGLCPKDGRGVRQVRPRTTRTPTVTDPRHHELVLGRERALARL